MFHGDKQTMKHAHNSCHLSLKTSNSLAVKKARQMRFWWVWYKTVAVWWTTDNMMVVWWTTDRKLGSVLLWVSEFACYPSRKTDWYQNKSKTRNENNKGPRSNVPAKQTNRIIKAQNQNIDKRLIRNQSGSAHVNWNETNIQNKTRQNRRSS